MAILSEESTHSNNFIQKRKVDLFLIMINVHVNVAGNFHMLITVVYSCSVAISSDKSRRVSSLLWKVFLHASASTVYL